MALEISAAQGSVSSGFQAQDQEVRKRSYLLRGLDCVGYIPLIGALAGLARIVGTVGFVVLKEVIPSLKAGEKEERIYATRAGQELMRGLAEIVGFGVLTIGADFAQAFGYRDWGDVASGSQVVVVQGESTGKVSCRYNFGVSTGKQERNISFDQKWVNLPHSA